MRQDGRLTTVGLIPRTQTELRLIPGDPAVWPVPRRLCTLSLRQIIRSPLCDRPAYLLKPQPVLFQPPGRHVHGNLHGNLRRRRVVDSHFPWILGNH